MKCELCKARAAETAIRVEKDGVEDELYVCNECARAEKLKRQKKSQRTRKDQAAPEVSVSITGPAGAEPPPPVIEAILDAVHGFVEDLGAASRGGKPREKGRFEPAGVRGVDIRYRSRGMFHLEGLHLVGEIDAAKRAFDAMGMALEGISPDGVADAGHVYSVMREAGDAAKAARAAKSLVEQERNARARLLEEMPRVFADSVCRALAVLKNCRLLSPGELFDLLSPLRLAAMEDMLEGVRAPEIEKAMEKIDLREGESSEDQDDRDRADAARADEANAKFEDVVLGDRAGGDIS